MCFLVQIYLLCRCLSRPIFKSYPKQKTKTSFTSKTSILLHVQNHSWCQFLYVRMCCLFALFYPFSHLFLSMFCHYLDLSFLVFMLLSFLLSLIMLLEKIIGVFVECVLLYIDIFWVLLKIFASWKIWAVVVHQDRTSQLTFFPVVCLWKHLYFFERKHHLYLCLCLHNNVDGSSWHDIVELIFSSNPRAKL